MVGHFMTLFLDPINLKGRVCLLANTHLIAALMYHALLSREFSYAPEDVFTGANQQR